MAFSNAVMTEFAVPRTPDVVGRIHGFYYDIGWQQPRADTEEPEFIYAQPLPNDVPTIAYWQTENQEKKSQFVWNDTDTPSRYARGYRLPKLHNLVEVCLVMPDNEAVNELWARGGELLVAHAHVSLQSGSDGAQEFRFSDPFNYSLCVTADPNYQLRPPEGH